MNRATGTACKKYGCSSQSYCGDNGSHVGFKQIGTHTCNVSNVVSNVVSNSCRVARIILWYALFNFSYKICANIGGLGIDATTNSGK